jgi:hypothetical protein
MIPLKNLRRFARRKPDGGWAGYASATSDMRS